MLTALATELESKADTTSTKAPTPASPCSLSELGTPLVKAEVPQQSQLEANKVEKDIHSLEVFPLEAQKIVRQDMGLVTKLNEDMTRVNSQLHASEERAKPLLELTFTLASDVQPEFTFQPADLQLLQQLEHLKNTLDSSQLQKAEDKLLAYIQATEGTPLVQKDNPAYQKALDLAHQLQKSRAGGISKILQKLGLRGQKINIPPEQIDSSAQELELSLKISTSSWGSKAKGEALALFHEAQAKVQTSVRQTLSCTSAVAEISQSLTQAQQDLEKAAYRQRLAQAMIDIDQKQKPEEQQEIITPLPDIKQLTKTVLQSEVTTILESARQQLQEKILATAEGIRVTKGGSKLTRGKFNEGGDTFIPQDASPKTIWTPSELNELYQQTSAGIKTFNETVTQIAKIISLETASFSLLTNEHPAGKNMANTELSGSIHLLSPLSKKDYQSLMALSLSLANNARDVFYHGVPATEARISVLSTAQLQSRKVQERTGGKGFFYQQDAARRSGAGSGLTKTDAQEAEQLCFYKNSVGRMYAQSPAYAPGLFYVAISSREIFRKYGFFEADGLHAFDRDNPENGFYYDLLAGQEDKVIMSKEALHNLEDSAGKESTDTIRKRFGDKIIIDDKGAMGIFHGELKDPQVQDAKTARIVPSGVFMDGPARASKRSIPVYQLYYN